MFSTHSTDPDGFASCWKTERSSTSSEAQTEVLVHKEVETQVSEMIDASGQTEEEIMPDYTKKDYNEDTLLQFLRQIAPKVEEELEKQRRSRAFDSYSQLETDSSIKATQLHVLRWTRMMSDGTVTCLDWNCTGSMIGVAYGMMSHNDWCDHRSGIALWNINRSDFSANQPMHELEISACVTSIAFHPTNLDVFAAGTKNGEVLIYDLSLEDVITPIATGDCEGESITSLLWVASDAIGTTNRSTLQYSLVSSTSSGLILMWSINIINQILKPTHGFLLMAEDFPKSSRSSDSSRVGVTSLSFNREDPSIFIVGVEGGAVAMCSTQSQINTGEKYGSINLNKCVTSHLVTHNGRIVNTDFSPYHRNALLTLASDDQICLHSLLIPNKPVSAIHSDASFTTACWSPSKPLIVASGNVKGEINFYSFANKNGEKLLSFSSHEKAAVITHLSFNKKNISLLGIGDALGRVTVWQLPTSIVSQVPSDKAILADLVNTIED